MDLICNVKPKACYNRLYVELWAPSKLSFCVDSRLPVTQDIIKFYELSFDCNLMYGRLKYASMLYCIGQYDQAADMLNHCESLLGPDVAHYCFCTGRSYFHQPETIDRKTLNTSTVELLNTSSTLCVKFCKHELRVVPEHLQFEMYRTQTQNDRNERKNELHIWMDMVVIDCVPFLYYLQYLVYSQKGNLPRRLLAMFNLMDYINQSVYAEIRKGKGDYETIAYRGEPKGHMDSALHVLAHCWELENRPDVAWHLYQLSIDLYPTNNIARKHLVNLTNKQVLLK